ncbi:MAG: electron transport complex subunit E [Clostridia bacterium]|nr:electron transport complex subunit E [Clostridia bacterium]
MSRPLNEIKKGFILENPVFRLMLGTCPSLALTSSASNAIGMGLAATAVLICSNLVISLLRKLIPVKVRIPAYITIIAGFVSVVQLIVKAYLPALDASLGIYLPLITVNCIILGRAEAFAAKNTPFISVCDGLDMGIGFTAALLIMGSIRELIGAGTLFGNTVFPESFAISIFVLPAGGFFVYGLLIALTNLLAEKAGKKPITSLGCKGCPSKAFCKKAECDGGDEK